MDVREVSALLSTVPPLPPTGPEPGVPSDSSARSGSAARENAVMESLSYLGSAEAVASLVDPYWPKWDSPWWHILLLTEMGLSDRVPGAIVRELAGALDRLPVKEFPFSEEGFGPDFDGMRHLACHCEVASALLMLRAKGLDPYAALPWARPWFPRYQMADGGLNCDAEAYLVRDEVASSMVGTIAPLEALLRAPVDSDEARAFVLEAGRFLIDRALVRGSASRHNAEERDEARDWLEPCFPRFYFYDVLRGLSALALWSERTGRPMPAAALEPAVRHLVDRYPDGVVVIGRRAYEGRPTIKRDPLTGTWSRGQAATHFPLLENVSRVGDVSPELTSEWASVRASLARAIREGRVV